MKAFTSRKALIVEDQDMFRDAMVFELESLGFLVSAAKEGQEGFELAKKEAFDVIISDVRMPNWDGKRLLLELRKSLTSIPPFLFMTGFTDLTIQEAYNMGADAVLGKPARADRLVATIESLLLPPIERWARQVTQSPKVGFHKQLKGWMTPSFEDECAIGRGGLSLLVDGKNIVDVRNGDRIGLDLELIDAPIKAIKGSGLVVWRVSGTNNRTRVGIEFEFLEEPGRSELAAYLRANRLVAAIPHRQATEAG